MKRFAIALMIWLSAACAFGSGYDIQQSTTGYSIVFLVVQAADHVTGLTGVTPTVYLSKNGAAGVVPSGAISAVDASNMPGLFKVAGNATDSNTLGPLALHATATGGDPVDVIYNVVAYNPQSATNLGLSALPTASVNASNGLITAGTGTNQIALTGGNVALSTFETSILTNGTIASATSSTVTFNAFTPTNGVIGMRVITVHGAVTQTRTITAYNSGTLTATISPPWDVTPTASDLYWVKLAGFHQLDLTQSIPTSNTAGTLGDAAAGAIVQAKGKWVQSGTTVTLYYWDNTTVYKTLSLNSASAPTSRTPQ